MPGKPLLSIRGLHAGILRDVNLDLVQGCTLGLVGPSGGGKSTLARAIALFERPEAGEICLEGRNLWALSGRERTRARAQVQLIFQDPAASLNPRFTAAEIVTEPFAAQPSLYPRISAADLLEAVGLPPEGAGKRALEFSGGERQRLAIARALALRPKLLILDESFSGLDGSVQAQISSLLGELRQRQGLTYLLISHDLALAAQLADEIAVMSGGAIVEHSPARDLITAPRHACSRELVDAARALSL